MRIISPNPKQAEPVLLTVWGGLETGGGVRESGILGVVVGIGSEIGSGVGSGVESGVAVRVAVRVHPA